MLFMPEFWLICSTMREIRLKGLLTFQGDRNMCLFLWINHQRGSFFCILQILNLQNLSNVNFNKTRRLTTTTIIITWQLFDVQTHKEHKFIHLPHLVWDLSRHQEINKAKWNSTHTRAATLRGSLTWDAMMMMMMIYNIMSSGGGDCTQQQKWHK